MDIIYLMSLICNIQIPIRHVLLIILIYLLMLIFLQKNKIDIMQRVIVTLCIISIPFFQSFSKRYSKTNLKIDIPSENIHFRMQVYKGKNYFILPKVASHSLNKYMDNERIWQWEKTYIIGKTNVILDSLKVGDIVGDICTGFYKIRKKTSFIIIFYSTTKNRICHITLLKFPTPTK